MTGTRLFDQMLGDVTCGDCIDVMSYMPAHSVDFILTDPPYLVNYRDRSGRSVANDNNDAWLKPAFAQMHRLLRRDALAVSFYAWNRADLFIEAWRAAGFRLAGHIVFRKRYASSVRFLRYEHESAYLLAKGQPGFPEAPVSDVLDWQYSGNRLHPTQKPVQPLKTLIRSFTQPGGIVLDPFCGCGTTIHAAQKMKRQWIGIDVTHLAISLIEKRLNDAFPGIEFEVEGTPKDLDGARDLAARDKYQFQWWAVSLVNAVPFAGKKKGADSGIDGLIYFKPEGKATEKAIVSVKGGESVNVAMVRDLAHVVDREKAKIGVFITLTDSTGPMRTEAVKTGYYETLYGKYPKIQIFTIRELFEGKQPNIPLVDTSAFKKAPKESQGDQDKLPF